MKNKIIKYLLALALCIICIMLILVGAYFTKTYSGKKMMEYCCSNTKVEATEFEVLAVTNLNGYKFYIAKNQSNQYQQEMFIFRKELLLGFIDLDRYIMEKQIVGAKDAAVSTVQFKAKIRFAKTETEVILFFSSNPGQISAYTIYYQENGHFAELDGEVSMEEAFVIGLTELGNGDYLHRIYECAVFYDQEDNIIEVKGNAQNVENTELSGSTEEDADNNN